MPNPPGVITLASRWPQNSKITVMKRPTLQQRGRSELFRNEERPTTGEGRIVCRTLSDQRERPLNRMIHRKEYHKNKTISRVDIVVVDTSTTMERQTSSNSPCSEDNSGCSSSCSCSTTVEAPLPTLRCSSEGCEHSKKTNDDHHHNTMILLDSSKVQVDQNKHKRHVGIWQEPTNPIQRILASCRQRIRQKESWKDQIVLISALIAWYTVGVGSIVTTKLLLTNWHVPPLLLTFQQLLAGSTVLRILLSCRTTGAQPWPWDQKTARGTSSSSFYYLDFVLTGLFNALDFLASNTAFSGSAASFVETIKASEPITTSAVALVWKIDCLGRAESVSLFLLITGVLLSTWGNSLAQTAKQQHTLMTTTASFQESLRTAITVMTANLCFAFRAMSQKLYRSNALQQQMDDINLLCRMQLMGALSLFLPACVFYGETILDAIFTSPTEMQLQYLGLCAVNTAAFVVYNLASCYVLSKFSVLQYSGLGCLRRMIAILITSILFGVRMNVVGVTGIFMCFVGFSCFTHYRYQRIRKDFKSKKDSDA